MNENVTILLWLILLGAIAVPVVWMIWTVIKRTKANEKNMGDPPDRDEAAPEDGTTQR
jgi:hypothetical protein